MLMMILPAVSAYQQSSCVDIKIPSNASSMNLTSVSYPNTTTIISNKAMTKNGYEFNYTLCSTSALGVYDYGYCDNAGVCSSNNFLITSNGQEPPSGIVIVFFSMLFIFAMFFLTYTIIDMLGSVFTLDYSVYDMARSVGAYFSLLAVRSLEINYLGNPEIHGWIDLFVQIGLWTHVILPVFSFVFLLIVGQWIKKKLMQREGDKP
jgi:hypothetical protein